MEKYLYSFYEKCCTAYANDPMFDGVMRYGEVLRMVRSRAAFLQERGIKKGTVVAIRAVNSPEWCISYMAITSLGAISVLIDTNLPVVNLPRMLALVDCQHMFVSDEYMCDLPGVTVFRTALEHIMGDPERFTAEELPGTAIASFFFTSGTTGDPKIVQIPHTNIIAAAYGLAEHMHLPERTQMLALLPLYHIYGMMGNFLIPILVGSHIYFLRSLKGPDIIKKLSEIDCRLFPAVPQLWELFFDGITSKLKAASMLKYRIFMGMLTAAPVLKRLGLGGIPRKLFAPVHAVIGKNMMFMASAGAAIKKNYFKAYRAMGFPIIEAYGLTETTGPLCASQPDNPKIGTVGKPLPGNAVRIKNKSADGIGEIWAKGPVIMPGYYMNDTANREVFDAEGWFNTGDVGYIDRDGDLFITGRTKNIIVLDSGKNVYPEELEEYYLQRCDQIAEISVFGRTVNGAETVYAVIMPKNTDAGARDRLKARIDELNRGLPSYKVISGFSVSLEPLPRNSSRKVLVREVKRLLNEGRYQEASASAASVSQVILPKNAQEEAVLAAMHERFPKAPLYARHTMQDLGIDSLKLLDLIVDLEERVQISIDPDKLIRTADLEEMVRYLGSCPGKRTDMNAFDIVSAPIKTKVWSFFNPLHDILLSLIRSISKVCWKFTAVNTQNLMTENVIIAVNHQSFLDILWLLASIPHARRSKVFMLGKIDFWFLAWIFPGLPVIFVEKAGNALSSLQGGADVLKQGCSLIVFPEGTRSFDGELGDFRVGTAFLAKKLNKKIIPVTIKGAYEIYPRHERLPNFFSGKKGALIVHDVIDPEQYASVDELTAAVRGVIHAELQRPL